MNPIFIRFGLPWLIFGSAVFALYWAIFQGENAIVYEPAMTAARQITPVPPAKRATDMLATKTDSTSFTAGRSPGASEATSETPPERRIPAITPNVAEASKPPPAAKAELTTETNIQQALQDVDPKIRYHALAESEAQGIAVPAHMLQQLATSDGDPTIRVLAMTKYSQDSTIDPALVRAVAEAGLRDRDASVSAHASEMLEQLNQASGFNDETPQLLPQDAAQ
jgi:hypothetical protein